MPKEGGQAGGPLFFCLFPTRACFERYKKSQVTFKTLDTFVKAFLQRLKFFVLIVMLEIREV